MMEAKCRRCDGVQKFSDYSTMHGFRELYYAKSAFWKIVWLLIIVGAIGLSVYQLYNAIVSALKQPTTTIIQPIDTDVEYPPLKVCYLHWMYWINWTLVPKIGFDRQTTLYAMSFLSDVLSDHTFDLAKTKSRFENAMNKNNFTTATQLYSAISNPSPPGLTVKDIKWAGWTKFIEPDYGRFCYLASTETIKNGLSQTANLKAIYKDKITLISSYDQSVIDYNYLHPQEVIINMRVYILSLLMHDIPSNATVNYLGFKAAPVLTVDNVKQSFLMPTKETFQSVIKITGTVYEWLNTNKRPCYSEDHTNPYYDNCKVVCYWQEMEYRNSSSCLNIEGAALYNGDIYGKLCKHDFTFMDTGNVVPGNYDSTTVEFGSKSYNSCIAELCKPACKKWDFASTASSTPVPAEFAFLNFPTTMYLEYPNKATVLSISEVKSQTWETLIGNLGGIVGLWLGASILSIVQMCYLLCCEHCDQKMSTLCCSKLDKRINASTRPKTVVLSSTFVGKKACPYIF